MATISSPPEPSTQMRGDNPLADYRSALLSNDRSAIDTCAAIVFTTYSRNVFHQGLKIWAGRANVHELADELTQTTFIKVWRNALKYHPENDAKTWIYCIAKNAAIDMYRKSQSLSGRVRAISSFSNEEFDPYDWCEDHRSRPGLDQLTSDETVSRIHEKIARLSTKTSFPTLMRMVADGASVKEIAEILKVPVGTVKSRTHKARQELLMILKESEIC